MKTKRVPMKTVTKLWIGIAVLALLSPLGVIIPALLGSGGAWGEWTPGELKELLGYIPAEMEKLSRLWSSPMPDYAVPGQKPGLIGEGLGYFATAIIGVAATAGLAYFIARAAGRKNGHK